MNFFAIMIKKYLRPSTLKVDIFKLCQPFMCERLVIPIIQEIFLSV